MTRPVQQPRFVGQDEHADVAVVVVTYNSENDLEALIASLRHEASDQRVRLVVADNGSTDDTVAVARRHDDVVVVATGGNLGYAGAINACGPYLGDADARMILNPDAQVELRCISTLRRRMASAGAAVVAPRVLDSAGLTYPSLRREPTVGRALGDALLGRLWRARPSWLSETVHDPARYEIAHAVDWASGAALLIDSAAAASVGEWDERFFLYSEETDIQRRLRDAGHAIWYEPAAVVHHAERGSGFVLPLDKLIAVNRVRYARKHMGRLRAAAYHSAVALHHLLRSSGASYRAIFRTVIDESTWASLPHARRDGPPVLFSHPSTKSETARSEAPHVDR